MNHIITVEELAESLDDIDPLKQAKIMKRIQIAAHELEDYATWSENCYTRNCLARTEKYEIILLCWDIGAKTPIHGHGGEDCWVYQVQGTVEEVRLEEQQVGILKETSRMALTPGKLTYMNDRMGYHTIENTSTQRAMTLHIYASPIDYCKVFNNKKDCFEIKEMSYHTFKGNEVEDSVA
jgi:cysteine dioxygenase